MGCGTANVVNSVIQTVCCGVYDRTEGQTGYLSQLEANWESLKNKREDLIENKKQLKEWIQDRTAPVGAEKWVKRAEDLEQKLLNILGPADALKPLPCSCLGCYPCFCSAYDLGKRIWQALGRTDQLLKDEIIKEVNNRPVIVPVERLETDVMLGMEEKMKTMLDLLQNDSISFIRIHGMGGTGKSTFIRHLNNKMLNDRLGFDVAIYVDLSEDQDIRRIHEAIGRRLGLSLIGGTNEHAGRKFYDVLENKRFLLLLDDLGEGLNFPQLAVPRPVPASPTAPSTRTPSPIPTQIAPLPPLKSERSKVVFTTRDRRMWNTLGVQEFEMDLLNEADARHLFKLSMGQLELAGVTASEKTQIMGMVDEVADLCGRLPLALVTVGQAMSGNTNVDEWNHTISWLGNPRTASTEPEIKVLHTLSVGYDKLKSVEQKCFLYCSLFHRNHLIEKEPLIYHWIAEGLLQGHDQKLSDALEHGRTIINKLIRVRLLMKGADESSVKLHHLIHGMASWVACGDRDGNRKEKFYLLVDDTLEELPEEVNWEEITKISVVSTTIAELKKIGCPNLTTLILRNSVVREIAGDFFNSMTQLKVLDFGWCKLPEFPKGIANLTWLVHLNLSHSTILSLPADMKNLNKLKFLDLSFTSDLQLIPSELLSSLSKLQFLNLYYCGFRKLLQVSGITFAILFDEVKSLKHLEELGITVKDDDDLQKLKSLSKLSCTRSLLIMKCKDTTIIDLTPITFVESLRVLHINGCLELTSIELRQMATVGAGCFKNLHDVEITDCIALKDLTWLKHAQVLELVKIEGCKELKKVITSVGANADPLPFLKLRKLLLSNLPELDSISDQILPFTSLEEIAVLNCSKLMEIPVDGNSPRKSRIVIKCHKAWWGKLQCDVSVKSLFNPFYQG